MSQRPESNGSAASGDTVRLEAFAEFVREHQAGLRAFIRALGVEADWVDDLAQETFIVAFRKFSHFDSTKDFGRWLRGIARHLVANERRKEARRARILSGALTDVLLEPEAPAEAADPLETDRLVAAINACVERLPERSRALLRRRYEMNESASVLAARFEMTADAIRQALQRIRVAVKQCVEQTLGDTWR